MMRAMSTLWKRRGFRRFVILLAVVAVAAIPLKVFFLYFKQLMPYLPKCPSVFFLNVHCPGCGSVRAVYCLFRGDIRGVFANNIMLPLTLLLLVVLVVKPDFCRHYKLFAVYAAVLVVFAVLRNLPWYPFTLLAPAGI